MGDKSSPMGKRACSERLMCALHVVAALAGKAEGGARMEAVLVKELVSDLQQIIGRHMFVSVRGVKHTLMGSCCCVHAHVLVPLYLLFGKRNK